MATTAPISRREAARRKAFAASALIRLLNDDLTIILSQVQLSMRSTNVSDQDLEAIGCAALRCKAAVDGLRV